MKILVIASLAAVLSTSAMAQTKPEEPKPAPELSLRTIDMTQILVDADSKPFPDPFVTHKEGEDATPLTLGKAIATAMCQELPDDKGQTGLDKAKQCNLGMLLLRDKAATPSATDVGQIEARLKIWSPPVALRVVQAIDPNQGLHAK